jgi:4-hydroxyacetophenone monooxygenase
MIEIVKPAEQLVTEDAAFIAHALEDANIPSLILALIHLTGDTGLLDGDIRPSEMTPLGFDGMISEADQKIIREKAVKALIAYRDGGCRMPTPPSSDTVHRMMNFITGAPISDEYVPMMVEEMTLDGVDRRAFRWNGDKPPPQARKFHTLVIGAGMSGIAAAIRLAEAGMRFTIIEKNTQVGGTWFENSYPGCRVDNSNHFYSYSFEPNHDWPEFFSQRDELFAYFNRCTDKYDLRRHIRFSTEVIEAGYDTKKSLWRIKLRCADGTEETVEANALISAVGQLNRPKLPDIKGRDTFRGPGFHSAAWEKQHDLKGKRVGVIGAGASAFQLIPEVAKIAGKLTVFQRTPAWMFPNPDYHRAVGDGKKWVMKHVPYYARWYRFLLFWLAGDSILPTLTIDPDWPEKERSVSAINEYIRELFTEALRRQLADRPDIFDKVLPKYPPWGKRVLQDNGHYLNAYKRDNAELITDGIAQITEDGITDRAGRHHQIDVIIYATGFHTNKFLWPMRIVGSDGQLLNEVWGDEPRAYLGITVPGFPNLFCLYGPGTNLAHGGSIIFHTECQVHYIMECLKALIESGHAVMDCKPEIYGDYVKRHEAALAKMVWSHPAVNNWFKNARGVVVNNSPWRLIDYWTWTKTANLNDYRVA